MRGGPVLERACAAWRVWPDAHLRKRFRHPGQPARRRNLRRQPDRHRIQHRAVSVGRLDHQAAMSEIFPFMADGKARLVVDQVLPMSDVAKAHEHLAGRGTRGKLFCARKGR